MQRLSLLALVLSLSILVGCQPSEPETSAPASEPEWTTLFDGTSLDNWNKIGDANWEIKDGAVEASSGNGFLVSPAKYRNFELRVEFWTDETANSGVFLRCSDPMTINQDNAYEVNIFDKRPDQTGRTAAIVGVAPPEAKIDAANQWNTFEIKADGSHLTVMMNGTRTVDVEDQKFAEGPIGLQYAAGVVKFRKVEIRPL